MLFHFKIMLQKIYTLFYKENHVNRKYMLSVSTHNSFYFFLERYVTSQFQVMVWYLKMSNFSPQRIIVILQKFYCNEKIYRI